MVNYSIVFVVVLIKERTLLDGSATVVYIRDRVYVMPDFFLNFNLCMFFKGNLLHSKTF